MSGDWIDDPLRLQELRADLLADGAALAGVGTPAWIHRPSTLRRVASELARALPPHFDRIVATGDGAEALGAAVSLATGVAFGKEGDMVVPGEQIVVVAARAADAHAYQNDAVTVVARRAVWAMPPGADALFTLPSSPIISPREDLS
ncbi:hypothetical protein [Microbacterium sp. SORGH_AS_0862]|uniref:hypothetical protein n=1 Tax=Microbacterium sp. SORGH_AS_0862 TaxID=3041789 RepID=UPI00278CCF77|nr:hypothetical protein [Microbacterium sp. SORGH_AS_0862]MDQ1205281.1 hypothetical protein [Microbacterium sp. SORGH_AS_0862]